MGKPARFGRNSIVIGGSCERRPRISIVIPTLNEAEQIGATLTRLQQARNAGVEVLVVDGGSSDPTVAVAQPLADRVLGAPRGRARQLNAGAKAAQGRLLVFLHADSLLPDGFAADLEAAASAALAWGRFDVDIGGPQPLLRVVAVLMNLRSRLTGIATGDHAIFATRALFERCGGFPEQPLMEDIAFCKAAKRLARPRCLKTRVQTSGRRWLSHGVLRTVLLMWRLRLAYFLGADPARLAARYRDVR